MKKRLVAALSAAVLCTSLFTACGGDAGTTSNEGEKPSTGNEETGNKVNQEGNELLAATDPSKLPQAAKDRKDTLIVGTAAPKGEFLPGYASTKYDQWVVDLVFSSLITNDEAGKPIPLAAESWEVSEDEKTYTFKIKKGIKFSNGEELTAKDVEFTYLMLADPSYDGPRSGHASDLVGYEEYNKGDATSIEGLKVIDDYTISFTNKEVNARAIWNCGMAILPKSVYEFDKGNIQPVKEKLAQPVGSGAYKFVNFKPGQEVKFEKNTEYFEGEPKIPTIVMKVTNASTLIQELVSGNVDIEAQVGAKPENIEQLQGPGFLDLNLYKANSYGYMGLNLEAPKLKDPAVRQALIYGLNRKGFMDAYYQGYGEVLNTHILPTSWAYDESTADAYQFNPEKANQILDEAGWTDSNGDGTRDKDGVELDISWLTYTDSKYVDTLIPVVQESWKAIGVKVTPELMEFSSMADKVRNDRNFDMYNMAWSLDLDPDPSEVFSIEQNKKGGFNSNRWVNEEADKLLKEAKGTTDMEKRKELYGKWQQIFLEDLPYICVGYSKDLSASSSRVKNYKPSTFRNWTYDVHLLELSE
ncbi:MAG: ABC transporter substrate-binding protein [Sarcina sp.]